MRSELSNVDHNNAARSIEPSLKPGLDESRFTYSNSLRALEKRDHYLEKIINKEFRPLIIIAGQSSAGKTQLVNLLRDMGYSPTVRLIPRERRIDDVESDQTWGNSENPLENHFQNGSLNSALNTIIFSDHKYQGYYAFPSKTITESALNGEGTSAILGRCVEIPSFIEGYSSILPLAPILPIRLDVPLQVLVNRLNGRYKEGNSTELNERITALEGMHRDDRPQIEYLTWLYGMRSIFNLAPSELKKFGYHESQIKSVTQESTPGIVSSFVDEALERSTALAKDIITRRSLDYGHKFIPDSLIDVLEKKLLPEAEKQGLSITLQGGLAAALYLENSRPVSLDIDFTIQESNASEARLKHLLESIDYSGHAFEAHDKWDKSVYHVRGFSSSAVSEISGEEVELDAIVTTRVQSNNRGFCFTFTYDALDFFHRRAVQTPNGGTVFLIPPERLIIEKLAAGRGPEIGKFDLFDSAGLIATLKLNPAAIRRIIDSQHFQPEIDRQIETLFSTEESYNEDEIIEILEIENPILKNIVREVIDQFSPSQNFKVPNPERVFGMNELKRLAFISNLDKSLNWISNNLNYEWLLPQGKSTLDMSYGGDKIIPAVHELQAHLMYYAQFELGRHDIYGRKPPRNNQARRAFFDSLPEQSKLLQKVLP